MMTTTKEYYGVRILKINEARPDKFYIQTKEMNDKFLMLNKEIQSCYNNSAFLPSYEELTQDFSLIIVKIFGLYNRAKFISIENNLVKVFLVDLGYEQTVLASECLGMDRKFAKVPALCIRCHLNVIPVDGNWSEEAIKFFQKELKNRLINVEFRDLKTPQISALIEVFWKDNIVERPFDVGHEITLYMSQIMITNKHATFMNVAIEEIDPDINGTLSPSYAAADSEDSTDDESILRIPVDHWQKAPITIKPVTNWAEVCVTHVDDVGQIHFQLKSDRKKYRNIRGFLHKTFDKTWVQNEIAPQTEQSSTTDKNNNEVMNVDWQPNQACVVLYRKDGHWYRGTVVESVSPLEYRVFLWTLELPCQE